jgi:uncharacterized lipoprotein YmbA
MMRKPNGHRLMVGLTMMALTACVNLSPSTSTETRFFLLHPTITAPSTSIASADLNTQSLVIGPVDVALYLKRPQLVTRPTASELRVDEFSHWAEPMPDAIARVIQENLSALTGSDGIHTYPTRHAVAADLRLLLNVTRFEADGNGNVTLHAGWLVIRPDTQQHLTEARSTIVQPSVGTSPSDVVEAMSIALATLTRSIGDALADSTTPESLQPD